MNRTGYLFLAIFAACSPGSTPVAPTYYDDVAPLFEEHCAECHAPGGVAGIVFDAQSTPALSGLILQNIQPQCDTDGCLPPRMPPWLPGPGDVAFQRDRSLSAAQIAMFQRWAAAPALGEAKDVSKDAPPVVAPDTFLETESYLSEQKISNYEQRCFVIYTAPAGYISAYRWRIDERAAVHHIGGDFFVGADADVIRNLDAADPGPGFDCSNGSVPGVPVGKLANSSIAPGQITRYPDGYGAPVPEGAVFVLSVHFVPSQQQHADVSGVDLWYAAGPVQPVKYFTQLVDSELPCPPSAAGLARCQREWAANRAITGSGLPTRDEILKDCGSLVSPGVEVGQTFKSQANCNAPLPPGNLRIISVRSHAHTRTIGTTLKAQRPDGTWFTFLDIPAWRWFWEDSFYPVQDTVIAGTIEMTCRYDNGYANQWSALTNAPADGPGEPPLLAPEYHVLDLTQANEMCQVVLEYVDAAQ